MVNIVSPVVTAFGGSDHTESIKWMNGQAGVAKRQDKADVWRMFTNCGDNVTFGSYLTLLKQRTR